MYLFKEVWQILPFPIWSGGQESLCKYVESASSVEAAASSSKVFKLRQVMFFDWYFCGGSIRPCGVDVEIEVGDSAFWFSPRVHFGV